MLIVTKMKEDLLNLKYVSKPLSCSGEKWTIKHLIDSCLFDMKSQVFWLISLHIRSRNILAILTLSVTAAALIMKSLTDTLISSEKTKRRQFEMWAQKEGEERREQILQQHLVHGSLLLTERANWSPSVNELPRCWPSDVFRTHCWAAEAQTCRRCQLLLVSISAAPDSYECCGAGLLMT